MTPPSPILASERRHPHDELLKLDDVANRLKVSRETARALCVSGKLPWVPVGTGSKKQFRRVLSSTLDAFMRQERKNAIGAQMKNVRETLAAMSAVEERW